MQVQWGLRSVEYLLWHEIIKCFCIQESLGVTKKSMTSLPILTFCIVISMNALMTSENVRVKLNNLILKDHWIDIYVGKNFLK